MPDPIFERYKEALRAGHVAALRGRPDDALLQYRSAAAIAPDRALPHVGMAEVFLRIDRLDDALAACAAALRLAPHDESVLELAGRVHEAAGRGTEASIHLDRVVDMREKQGRAADALEAATRAHAAAPTDTRRDRVAALTSVVEAERARLSDPAWAPDAAEAPAAPPIAAAGSTPEIAGRLGPRDAAGQGAASVEAAPDEASNPPDASADATTALPEDGTAGEAPALEGPGGDAVAGGEEPAVDAVYAGEIVPRAVPAGPIAHLSSTSGAAAAGDVGGAHLQDASRSEGAGPIGMPTTASVAQPVADPGTLFVAAEEQAAAGDPAGAAALYVEAAAAYLGMGAVDTAVDACLRALSGAPAGTDVHLALASIDVATGHAARAADRLDLLGRLLSLEGDEAGVARVTAFRAGAGVTADREGPTPGA